MANVFKGLIKAMGPLVPSTGTSKEAITSLTPAQWFQPEATKRAYETYAEGQPKIRMVDFGTSNPFSSLLAPVEDFGFPKFGAMANGGLAQSSSPTLQLLIQLLGTRRSQ